MNNSKSLSNPWMIPVTLGVSSVAGFLLGKLLGQRKLSALLILKMKARLKEAGSIIKFIHSNGLLLKQKFIAEEFNVEKTTS